MMFPFTGCSEPWSHRDQVQSSVHWTVLGLCEELGYLAHLTFQVQDFTRGFEGRVFSSATSLMPLLLDGWNHQIPTLCRQSQPPGKRFVEKGDQRRTVGGLSSWLPAVPSGSPNPPPP